MTKIDLKHARRSEIIDMVRAAPPEAFGVMVDAVHERLRHESLVASWREMAKVMPPLSDDEVALVRSHRVVKAIQAYRARTALASPYDDLANLGFCKWLTEQVQVEVTR